LNEFLEYQKELVNRQSEFRDNLAAILQSLQNQKKLDDLMWREIKDAAKPLFKQYSEESKIITPKNQLNYYKKAEIEKELIDGIKVVKVILVNIGL
jgi:hypothetical protein